MRTHSGISTPYLLLSKGSTVVTILLLRVDTPGRAAYVDDVVDGLIGCAQTPDVDGRTVELGSGEMLSIRATACRLHR